jgi:hypothetical protein
MTDEEIDRARDLIAKGLAVSGSDGPATREARAVARRVAADLVSEVRLLNTAIRKAREHLSGIHSH